MKHTRKFTALFLGVLMATTVAMTACQAEPDNSNSETTGAVVDTAPETKSETESETEAPATPMTVTLTVQEGDGTLVPAAVLRITSSDNDELEPVIATTDTNGVATASLLPGEYLVTFDTLPDMFIGGSTEIIVEKNMEPVTLEVINNTPDGSEQHPFFVSEKRTPVTIPAATTHYFSLFSGDRRSIVVENANAEITMNCTIYRPDESGRIEIRISSDNPQEHVIFAINNKTEAELSLTILIESDRGALDNPLIVSDLGEITASVPKGLTVYYSWLATKAGTLQVSSDIPSNDISLHNKTSGLSSSSTSGGKSTSVAVAVGDVISINVAANTSANAVTEIIFTLSMADEA